MSRFYQDLDRPHFDYELWRLPGIPQFLRGPVVDIDTRFGVCIGAAQTFGRFCARPFPALLSEALGIPVLNLAVGGSGPALYRQKRYLDVLRSARFVVAQVLSGRSASNSEFRTGGGIEGHVRRHGRQGRLEPLLAELIASEPPQTVARVLRETREDYATHFAALLDEVGTRTVLFWFARRTPDYTAGLDTLPNLLGGFPQLIDRATLDAFRPHADEYVECVSSRGLPQRLWVSDEAVEGTRRDPTDGYLYNRYYPSPDMHRDAADALMPACARLLAAPLHSGTESTEGEPGS